MSPLIRAVIDSAALAANLQTLRKAAPRARIAAVVKANAYGHGLVHAACALAAADAFAVARIEDGIALRAAGITQSILILEGVITRDALAQACEHDFDLMVHETLQIELLHQFAGAHRFVLWLKIDTGMNRLGFRCDEFPDALARVRALPTPAREIRLVTHLARADDRQDPTTGEQLKLFKAVTRGLSYATSIANSAGILGSPAAHGDWVRPGLALYGVSPFANETAASLGLVPVMSFETTVIATRRVARGESVGYGGTWRAPQDTTVAILAGGYGDGLPRSLRNGTPVLVNKKRAALVGRVSMDMIAVDVADIADVHVGTRCTLWGVGLPVEEIAACANTISYELLCGISSRRVPLEVR
ncbi:MAG TPA: alanine racemase [Steroidobacteraceae bacterium]